MDAYAILNVDRKCSQDEIKKAYRKLSMKFHPDKNGGDASATSKFQEITHAYSEIDCPEKRQQYDNKGHSTSINMNEANFMNFMQHTMGPMGPMGPNNPQMFNPQMFANMHEQAKSPLFKALQKPQPIVKKLTITLELAFQGGSIPLDITRWQVINGEKTTEVENIYVDVPPGIDNNEMLIIREKGNILNHHKGDVKIFILIEPSSSFKRNGLDLIYEKEISLKEALCGFNFNIKYINGKMLKMNNNAGSIIHPTFQKMVGNLGFKRGEHVGNLIIIFNVKFPSALTSEQIDAIGKIL